MGLRDWLFPRAESVETFSTLSISDPALAEYFGVHADAVAGVSVSETTSLGVTAFWRGCNIVAGTIAGLPLKTYERVGDDGRRRVDSWLDDPGAPWGLTPFDWTRLIILHQLLRGNAYLRHATNVGGALIGAFPVYPSSVTPKWVSYGKEFEVRHDDGTRETLSDQEMSQVMGLSIDGLEGMSPLTLMRRAVALGIANEQSAGTVMGEGLSIRAIISPDEDWDEGDAEDIGRDLREKMTGVANAGGIAVVNRMLKTHELTMALTPADAQFLESRAFQVEEFARMTGVPPHLLMQTEKQTSWGTGVQEQNLGLQRYTLMGWTTPLEQTVTRLLPPGQFAEFDYKGLLQGTPAQEIALLIEQVTAGLLTVDEARAIMNLGPKPEEPNADQEESTEGDPEDGTSGRPVSPRAVA